MNRRKTRFSENESRFFLARHLDNKRRIEIACEIRRSARALARLFVAFARARKDKIAQLICPTCRIGHSAPDRKTQKMPLRPRGSFTRGHATRRAPVALV